MEGPPDKSATDKIASLKALTMQSDANQVGNHATCGESSSSTQAHTTAATPSNLTLDNVKLDDVTLSDATLSNITFDKVNLNNVAPKNFDSKDPLDAVSDEDVATSSSNDINHAASGKCVAAPVHTTTSLFMKIPGELRNRIYRDYFDDFQQERMDVIDFRRLAPTFLNLLRTDHTIRTEAGSIFYKEYLPVDRHNIPWYLARPSEPTIQRIKAISSLVSLRDTHMRVSLRHVSVLPLKQVVKLGIELANFISGVKKEPVLTDWQLVWDGPCPNLPQIEYDPRMRLRKTHREGVYDQVRNRVRNRLLECAPQFFVH